MVYKTPPCLYSNLLISHWSILQIIYQLLYSVIVKINKIYCINILNIMETISSLSFLKKIRYVAKSNDTLLLHFEWSIVPEYCITLLYPWIAAFFVWKLIVIEQFTNHFWYVLNIISKFATFVAKSNVLNFMLEILIKYLNNRL